MEKICFKSEERAAKERLSQQMIFVKKNWSQNHIYTMEFLGSPNPRLYGNPFRLLRNCLKLHSHVGVFLRKDLRKILT